MPAARVTAVCLAALAAGLVAVPACRTATEVTVNITTDVPCTKEAWQGIAVYAGSPGLDVETKAPSLTSTSCDAAGNVGSIVLIPSGSDDADIEVRVVAGVSRAPDDCATYGYDGCIVARRSLAFIPHKALTLTIALEGACIGNACDALHTCVEGVCDDATLTTSASTGTDAGSTAPAVRCGDNGVTCPTSGEICCLQVDDGGTQGSCRLPAECPPTRTVLACDDETDCIGPPDDAGYPLQCCLQFTVAAGQNTYYPSGIQLSQCLPIHACVGGNGGLGMCQHRLGCDHGALACQAANDSLPGYFWCDLPSLPGSTGDVP